MSLYLQTHIVQKGETLEDIVLRYNIPNVELLRYYHNQNAPKGHHHIGSVVVAGQEIFVPNPLDIQKILDNRLRLKEKNKFNELERLKNEWLRPSFLYFNAQYQFNFTYYNEDTPEKKETLSSTMIVKHMGTSKDNLPILQYQKKNYKINGKDPDSKLYNLAIEKANFIYPIDVSIDRNGKPLRM